MKVIIAGSRTVTNYAHIAKVADFANQMWRITEVVCGMASGADQGGRVWAQARGIAVKEFPADWYPTPRRLDRDAGKRRNQQMADYADVLVALWDGTSPGTRDMIQRATRKGLQLLVIKTKG